MKRKKYMVFNTVGNKPKFVHETLEQAREEAMRVAELNRDGEVIVLQVLQRFKATTIVEELFYEDEEDEEDEDFV